MNNNLLLIFLSSTSFLLLIAILVLLLIVKKYFHYRLSKTEAKIKEEIKASVQPKFLEFSIETKELVELALEIWRIERRIVKLKEGLDESQYKGLENSTNKMKRYLEKHDINIVDYQNTKYNDGLSLEILDVIKDQKVSNTTVKETVEPIIMYKGHVVLKGKVILLANH